MVFAYFLALLATDPLYFIYLGLSQVYKVLFLLKIFSRLGNIFPHFIPYSKIPFAVLLAVSL